jgi:hypothetical protein
VLVVEDDWQSTETASVYDALRTSPMYDLEGVDKVQRVVVGVCSLDLKPGSWHRGKFQSGGKRVSLRGSASSNMLTHIKPTRTPLDIMEHSPV